MNTQPNVPEFTVPAPEAAKGQRNRSYSRSDAGNAELFAALYGDKVRFDHKQGRWLIWDEKRGRWYEDKRGEVRRLAKKAARCRAKGAVGISDADESKAQFKWAKGSENRYRIDAALELTKSEAPISDDGEGWDADPLLCGVANGVVDLRTGKFRPGTREDRITKFSPVTYIDSAKCSRFEKFIEEIFGGDSELIAFVQKAAGYTLTGSTQEQVLFACYGEGANGKSTFLEILVHILGDYGTDLPFSTLEKKRQLPVGEGTSLPGARFAKSVETREDLQLDEARIKSWTGGDTISINPKYRPLFSFTPTHKLWLAFNHKPEISDDSKAMWRRVRLIRFTRTFGAKDADNNLLNKLKAEASGILNWAIAGCLAWQKGGLNPPKAVEDASCEYQAESDPLAPFFEDCCELGPTFQVTKGALSTAYQNWCRPNKERPCSRRVFADKMKSRGFVERRDGQARYWAGLRLLDDDTSDAMETNSGNPPYKNIDTEDSQKGGELRHQCHGNAYGIPPDEEID
jgi:putative DNA primase/helicase